MTAFIKYQLDEESTILVQLANEKEHSGMEQASLTGSVVRQAQKGFREALVGVKSSAKIIIEEIKELAVDEIELSFGIEVTGEGDFAIASVGLTTNYQITLKWNKLGK